VKITVDRTQSTPVYVQIKAQITYQIGLGLLKSGQRLPPIRHLAAELGVAPLTVMQALNELAADGLVETRHGSGTYVVELQPELLAQSRRAAVESAVSRGLEDARNHGISEREFVRAAWARVFPGVDAGGLGRRAVMIGNYADDTPLLAAMVQTALRDYRLEVAPRTIQELRDDTYEARSLIAASDLIIAVPLRLVETRRIVGADKLVVPLPLTLSPTTREQLAQLPDTAALGMVVTESRFKQSMRNVVALYHPTVNEPPVVAIDEEHAVGELVRSVDVVVYSMGIRDHIRPLLTDSALAIELAHIPDPAAISELRRLLDRMGSAPDGAGLPLSEVTSGAE
jgi:DNA-binding transcriptional regulator YhcF (GntR family)